MLTKKRKLKLENEMLEKGYVQVISKSEEDYIKNNYSDNKKVIIKNAKFYILRTENLPKFLQV